MKQISWLSDMPVMGTRTPPATIVTPEQFDSARPFFTSKRIWTSTQLSMVASSIFPRRVILLIVQPETLTILGSVVIKLVRTIETKYIEIGDQLPLNFVRSTGTCVSEEIP